MIAEFDDFLTFHHHIQFAVFPLLPGRSLLFLLAFLALVPVIVLAIIWLRRKRRSSDAEKKCVISFILKHASNWYSNDLSLSFQRHRVVATPLPGASHDLQSPVACAVRLHVP